MSRVYVRPFRRTGFSFPLWLVLILLPFIWPMALIYGISKATADRGFTPAAALIIVAVFIIFAIWLSTPS